MAGVKKSVGQEAGMTTSAGAGGAVSGGSSHPRKHWQLLRRWRRTFASVTALLLLGVLALPAYSQTGSQLGPLPPKLPQLPVVPLIAKKIGTPADPIHARSRNHCGNLPPVRTSVEPT